MITKNPTDYEMHLFHEGTLYESYRLFGAHLLKSKNSIYTRFCVWAPNAEIIRLVGDFNDWNGKGYHLHRVNTMGIWSILINKNLEGAIYKFEIVTKEGRTFLKSDPYSFYSEIRPKTASIVYSLEGYQWNDHHWLRKKSKMDSKSSPLSIYELHLSSWKKQKEGTFYSYRDVAEELIPYVVDQGFTHIELLPLVEHPLDDSWGYQGTGYFSVTSRYGTPHDFMYFIDQCHQNGIGVILDWVPGHFCKDVHGLFQFDGTHLYEYEVSEDRENVVWGTANFNLGKNEVLSFLISNALFWMDYYHIDGFRVDAVANIIYWPNRHDKKENPYGIQFLKMVNEAVRKKDPTFLMMAEDSTDFPAVTSPVQKGGLGFTYKWNMGWMNDILAYMESGEESRSYLHEKVTFSLLYAFTESFILPLSHDEVVHGKKSLLNKMPGDYEEKFAQLRLLLGYMIAHPGKKLLFMGTELAQYDEWKDKEQLDWNLLDYEMHRNLYGYVRELLKLYRRSRPLYELDQFHEGFEWIDVHNFEQSIFSFIRKGKNPAEYLIIVCNFRKHDYQDYRIGVPKDGSYREIFNSNKTEFGGMGKRNKTVLKAESIPYHGKPFSIRMTISAFGFSVFRPVNHRKERKGSGKEKVRSDATSWRKRE